MVYFLIIYIILQTTISNYYVEEEKNEKTKTYTYYIKILY